MASPPLLVGARQLTTAAARRGLATGLRGAPGAPVGTTAADGADAAELPTALVAITVNVYAYPLTSPVTVHPVGLGETPTVVEQVRPPGAAVTT